MPSLCTYLSHKGSPLKSRECFLCETCDLCTDRRGRYRQSIRKATGAADSRSDEEAQAIGGRLPVKHQLIAAAKADIEPHTVAPIAVARPLQGRTPGRCRGAAASPVPRT